MTARTARPRRALRAVKPAGGKRGAGPAQTPRPSEIVELVYQLMIERGAVPRREVGAKDRPDDDVRMAEAP